MKIDFGKSPKPAPKREKVKGTSYLPFLWSDRYSKVIFNTEAFTDSMEVIYFEPVIGYEGTIAKEFNAHIMAQFNDDDTSIYVVPKRLLRGIE